jgi:hypothetical protein
LKKLVGLLAIILISNLVLLSNFQLGQVQASETVNGIITSDTTWTSVHSPYTFTGPVAVNAGVTLTIEAGTIVNLGKYYLQVNGTLQTLSSQDSKVQFNGGEIIFTQISNGWNDQSGTGCKIENAVLNQTPVYSRVALKIVNCKTNEEINVWGENIRKSLILNNIIDGSLYAENADILNNQINHSINAKNSQIIGCTVFGGITGGSLSITDCVVNGQSTIDITGDATITNCTISGGGVASDMLGRVESEYATVTINDGSIKITGSSISGDLKIQESTNNQNCEISNNKFSGLISVEGLGQIILYGNQVEGIIRVSGSTVIIQNNAALGISFDGTSIVACDNTVCNASNYYVGINARTQGSAIIERNLIFNTNNGICCASQGITIRNNTIKDNDVGINIEHFGVTISNNNFENNKYSIFMSGIAGSYDVEATNNYWGTTDKTNIDNSIFDYYDDSYLAKVNYLPLLSQQNPQAMPVATAPMLTPSIPSTTPTPNAMLIESNSTVSAFTYNASIPQIIFNVTGPEGTTGYIRLSISKTFMPNAETIQVYVDDNKVNLEISSDGDFWQVTFTYHHSSHQVTINAIQSQNNANLPDWVLPLTIAGVAIALSISAVVFLWLAKKKA